MEIKLIVHGAETSTGALAVKDTAFPEATVVSKYDLCATGLNSQRNVDATFGLDENSRILAPFVSKKDVQGSSRHRNRFVYNTDNRLE